MEGGEDVHGGGEIQHVDKGVGVCAKNFIGSIVPDHELSDTIRAALHVLVTSMEGGQHHEITFMVLYLRSAVAVCSLCLRKLCIEQVVLGFKHISVDLLDETCCGLAIQRVSILVVDNDIVEEGRDEAG